VLSAGAVGEGCRSWRVGERAVLCVVSACGTGPQAAHVAGGVLEVVSSHLGESLPELFARCDGALRGSAGAAMGVAVVDHRAATLSYAAVGGVRGVLLQRPPEGQTLWLSGCEGRLGSGLARFYYKIVRVSWRDVFALWADRRAGAHRDGDVASRRHECMRWLLRGRPREWWHRCGRPTALLYTCGG